MLSYRRTESLAGDRILRLFACACCRHVPRWMRHERIHQAVELSERFADGWAIAKALGPGANPAPTSASEGSAWGDAKDKDLATARDHTRVTIAEWIVQPKGPGLLGFGPASGQVGP